MGDCETADFKKKFLIIDGSALLHRAYHALPRLSTKEGIVINAVYGFTSVLIKILKELKPTYVAVAFDLPTPTFRHKEFKEYKAQRPKQPQELYDQIPLVKEILESFQIPVYEKEGYEADDIIATICVKNKEENKEIENIILTGDLDTLQLVDKQTSVLAFKKGISETILYNEDKIRERFNLEPTQLVDYKALRGDPSDNIPGVRGIGEKIAAELIRKFGSLEKIYEKKEEIRAKIREILEKNKEIAEKSKNLVTLCKNVPLDFKLEEAKFKKYDMERISKVFQKLEFQSLLKRIYDSNNSRTDITKNSGSQNVLF